ncbi:polysaccharide pyruvyl transferase family protein [Agaribacter marinus]|nr:polysaccharide pyruvyl transferase family protein [Agaribacter marinus]
MKKLLPEFLRWRYELYLSEHVDLYGSLSFFVKYHWHNFVMKHVKKSKVIYMFANKGNVGDYISHLGVKHIVGLDGQLLFCTPIAISTIRSRLAKAPVDTHLVIGGGGLLQPVFSPVWDAILQSSLRYSVLGIGINYMEGRAQMPATEIEKIIQGATFCGVRDDFTEQEFTRHGCAPEKLAMSICPSINYFSPIFTSKTARKPVLLHMIHPSDLRLAGAEEHVISSHLRTLASEFNLEYQAHTNICANHEKPIRMIAQASLVVSSRLHGCIMSYGLQTRFLALLCDNKMAAFLRSHTNKEGIDAASAMDIDVLRKALNIKLSETENDSGIIATQLADNLALGQKLRQTISQTGQDA